ncbi:hypothetical protein [Citrobacter arsenatis]|uniref:hypothetical protein n=1 Tax=Citrobacter arsenatis TaxID=2546350 RepID=UPI00300E4311
MPLNFFGQVYELAFEVSPILLVDGIASNIPGGILPIAVITEGLSIANGLLQGKIGANPSTRFIPQPGTTLVQQDVAGINFYNQIAAANAVVSKPNRVVMQMLRPVSTASLKGYGNKLMTFTALKMALDMHNQSGGTYTVLTPGFIYAGCLFKSMVDNSGLSGQNKQAQYSWLIEFEQPLLSISELDTRLGNLMSKFEAGIPSASSLPW